MDGLVQISADLLFASISILDALPDSIRALLAALLLVAFLRFFESRIASHEVQFGQSFRKTALVALIVIPLLVWLFPASRMVVFVEELPLADQGHPWFWWAVACAWLTGLVTSFWRLLSGYLDRAHEVSSFIVLDDEKLGPRLAHWQRRLGMNRTLHIVQHPGDRPRQLHSSRLIGFPQAAAHWPGSAQDVLIIHALSHLKKRHGRWHSIAQLVSCLYWPVTWVQTLHANLLQDFQRATDELAESCYGDRLGYQSALKQLTARLSRQPGPAIPASAENIEGWRAIASRLDGYWRRLRQLGTPAVEPEWDVEALVAERATDQALQWTDPYDKVVLFIGQAVFLAFLITGVTLKEKPPEADYEYSMPFELLWKEHFHRNQELLDKLQRTE